MQTEWRGKLGDRLVPPGGGIILAMLLEIGIVVIGGCCMVALWYVMVLAMALRAFGL